jgi:hypothetical protein
MSRIIPSARAVPLPPVQSAPPSGSLNARIAEAQRPGLEAAARIQSGAFATSVALSNAVMLSRTTDAAFAVSPLGENSYRKIFEAFANFATREIEALSFHEGGRY